VLQSTGAYLRQFLVDDKGCVLIACWGMPHLSYLDNASRALSAAAKIHRKLNKLEMECSFGITTGDVYCGTVGSSLRMEYAAIGSVVNMAARLMGKAHGGILIDDPTFVRLAPSLKTLSKALDPIKVKGREEPLPVFSYDSIEMVHVKEKVVEDHEISAACREALLNLVAHLQVSEEPRTRRSPSKFQFHGSQKSVLGWLNGSEQSISLSSHGKGAKLRLVILKGKEGSGRTTAVHWLQKKAADRDVPVYTVRVTRRDCLKDFFLWKRLFQLMVPKNIFVSNAAQRAYVKTLLDEIYPGNPHQAHNTGFPLLRSILGITCTFNNSAEDGQSHKMVGWLSRKEGHSRQQVHYFLIKVFTYLLKARPSLIIIENVEGAHEPSLNLLLDLVKVNVHAGIVLTALEDETGVEAAANKVTTYQTRASYRWDLLNSSPWSKYFKAYLQSRKFTVTVAMQNFPPAEIDRLLCATLQVQTVPPEISQLVQDFSGGSYFWVREILQFITDFGAQQFLSAVDDGDSGSVASDITSARTFTTPKLKPSASMSGGLTRGPSSRQMGTGLRLLGVRKSVEAVHLVQLNKLVLCRFGNLSADEQRVLRTASIAGVDFSLLVLNRVLAEQLHESLADCLETLLNQRWVFQDADNESLYHFAHAHAHRILYELTPSSERAKIHQQVAEQMEVLFSSEKKAYTQIAFQYQQCKSDRALIYLSLAFPDLLLASLIYDLSDCLDLLTGAVPCCKSVENVDALLKLLDRAEFRILSLNIAERQSLADHLLSILKDCGCSGGPAAAAVVPTDDGTPSAAAGQGTKSTTWEERKLSSQTPQEGDQGSSYDARVKRMFLAQISNLRGQLTADRAKFAADAKAL
jgi:hypothetical protein